MTHADTIAADPAQTILAIEAELARLEQAEAAMQDGPWTHRTSEWSCFESGGLATVIEGPDGFPVAGTEVAQCEEDIDAEYTAANHAGIAAMRNDAPDSLRFRRDMLAMCREWLDNDYGGITAQHYHDAALRIIAALAASLGVG